MTSRRLGSLLDVTAAPLTPPRWLNALMRFMLRTPGLQRLVGRSTALLTFTGRRSGKSFATPITFVAGDGRIDPASAEAQLADTVVVVVDLKG